MEGITLGAAGGADPERSGRVHHRDVLDHRRPQGEGVLRRPVSGHRAEPVGQGRQHRHHGRGLANRTTRSCVRCRALHLHSASRTSTRAWQLQQYDTYSACIEALKNGAIDAVTTDEVILAGYAAQSPGRVQDRRPAVLRVRTTASASRRTTPTCRPRSPRPSPRWNPTDRGRQPSRRTSDRLAIATPAPPALDK